MKKLQKIAPILLMGDYINGRWTEDIKSVLPPVKLVQLPEEGWQQLLVAALVKAATASYVFEYDALAHRIRSQYPELFPIYWENIAALNKARPATTGELWEDFMSEKA